MTLNDLIRSAQNVASLLTSGEIPLLYNGKEADYYISLNKETMKAELYIKGKEQWHLKKDLQRFPGRLMKESESK